MDSRRPTKQPTKQPSSTDTTSTYFNSKLNNVEDKGPPEYDDNFDALSAVSLPTISTNTRTDSLFSGSAGSSSISFRGPGSLAGRAILNLGRLTLKGVERVIISRKLSGIGSLSRGSGSAETYSDILELSRPQMYPDNIHTEAMRLLVRQIASGRTENLLKALRNWHPIEIRLLLSEMIGRFDDTISSTLKPLDSIMRAYKLNLSTRPPASRNDHSFVPFIDFLRHLISLSPSLPSSSSASSFASPSSFSFCTTTLETGLLDFLFHLYASDFRDPLTAPSSRAEPSRKSTLSIACNDLLLAVCEYGCGPGHEFKGAVSATAYIQTHPIHALWSIHPALSSLLPSNPNAKRMLKRKEAWLLVEKEWIRSRITSMYEMMLDVSNPDSLEENFVRDAFVDMVQFAGLEFGEDEEIAFRALRSLHQLIHARYHWPDIKVYLYDDDALAYAGQAFPRIIKRLCALVANPYHPFFFFALDKQDFRQTVVVHFIQWMSRASYGSSRCLRLIASSGILELVEATKKKSDPIDISTPSTLPSTSISTSNPLGITVNSDRQFIYRQAFLSWAPMVFASPGKTSADGIWDVHRDVPLFLALPKQEWDDEWDEVVTKIPGTDKEWLYKWIIDAEGDGSVSGGGRGG
ncbi:hypothetical protein D9758_008663 [Tetrapyrgos nigripes]|uniref:Uncharacterized protein n=1 Tax=Tetrapyrgos nigripes TaxID=182062 RepID=A0A8H5D4W0_9AGAR|nr:hypothetical protein D9758_008663 [Tetrapyrgos nigripes]